MPIWVAVALVAAAYLARTLLLRGGDFRPDLPADAIVLFVLVVGIGGVALVRAQQRRDAGDHDPTKQGYEEDTDPGDQR